MFLREERDFWGEKLLFWGVILRARYCCWERDDTFLEEG